MVYRGEIYLANLSPVAGSEQGGIRPVLVIQNDIGNENSPTTIVAALTGNLKKIYMPTHVELSKDKFSLDEESIVLLEQIRTIDKLRLGRRISKLDDETMAKVDEALAISVGLTQV